MSVRALVVDDERLARERLIDLLSPHPDIVVVGEAGTVAEAQEWLHRHGADVVFLDVQMPGATGLELDPGGARVIFVTAFAEHALEAFELPATDYLLKPVSPARLAKAIERLVPARTHYTVRDGGKLSRVALADILHVRGAGDYAELVLADGRMLLSDEPLRTWATRLGERGLRIHRGHLVAMRAVRELVREGDTVCVRLVTGEEVPVARRRVGAVRARLEKT